MQNVELVCVHDKVAKYRLRREQVISGVNTTITYYVYFSINRQGVWQIEQF